MISSAFRRGLILLFLTVVSAALLPRAAFADCANPVGQEGNLIYNATIKMLQFCDGTNWINTAGVGGGGGGGGTEVAFSVHKNGSSQTVSASTNTKVTWSTEVFDTNNNFDLATERFTPTVAGKYIIQGSARCTASDCQTFIYKNGTAYADGTYAAGVDYATVVTILELNGTTDYVELFVWSTGITVDGAQRRTYFTGSLLQGGGGGGAETDPEVGTLTANKWCQANAGGTAIVCTADAPGADNLGNHTATQNINAGGFNLLDAGKIKLVGVVGSSGVNNNINMKELLDVDDALAPANGQVLTYSSASGKWVAGAPGSGGGPPTYLGVTASLANGSDSVAQVDAACVTAHGAGARVAYIHELAPMLPSIAVSTTARVGSSNGFHVGYTDDLGSPVVQLFADGLFIGNGYAVGVQWASCFGSTSGGNSSIRGGPTLTAAKLLSSSICSNASAWHCMRD